jgi:hypothetical protein
MCDIKGCDKPATWRMEYIDDFGDFVETHTCDEHYPQDPEINKMFISVRRL